MTYDPTRHHRRSIRLKGYDYTQPGAYFVTICTHERTCLFGEVVDGVMVLNAYGRIAQACWESIPDHFPHVQLDAVVIMPNHMHGIIWIVDDDGNTTCGGGRGTARRAPTTTTTTERFGAPVPGSLPTIIRSFKSAVTKHINAHRGTPGAPVWQRNYYEHIIRNEQALNAIRRYIAENPLRWHLDRYNSAAVGPDPQAIALWHLLRESPRPSPSDNTDNASTFQENAP